MVELKEGNLIKERDIMIKGGEISKKVMFSQ
jgi:hypothetical protein